MNNYKIELKITKAESTIMDKLSVINTVEMQGDKESAIKLLEAFIQNIKDGIYDE